MFEKNAKKCDTMEREGRFRSDFEMTGYTCG